MYLAGEAANQNVAALLDLTALHRIGERRARARDVFLSHCRNESASPNNKHNKNKSTFAFFSLFSRIRRLARPRPHRFSIRSDGDGALRFGCRKSAASMRMCGGRYSLNDLSITESWPMVGGNAGG